MDIQKIRDALAHQDFQYRLKGLVALRDYDVDTAVPLLLSKRDDPEFLVRSFVAMGLGRKRNEAAFNALLEIIRRDRDANVQAEATNSLAMYGEASVSPLVQTFHENPNWLVRRSILAAMLDLDHPPELLELSLAAIKGDDVPVAEAGIDTLGTLAQTDQHPAALEALLALAQHKSWNIRMHAARSLKQFETAAAKAALGQLRQDPQHQVVAAALEDLLP
ncbi:MAG: HEAT repeat domain-containing protein [Leptolyngbya sp. SIO4C1]|nr:HEAT repeat domain-containing protein [Leptolyngbya sp. SIO4C1]